MINVKPASPENGGRMAIFVAFVAFCGNPKMHFSKDFFGAVTYLARFVTPIKGEDDEISALTPKWWQRAVDKNEHF